MAVSGTTTFNPDFVDAIEEAFERAGVENRTGYDMRSARRSINLLFADWANRGFNMWALEERTQALTGDDGEYTLGTDIVDLVETMIELTGSSPVQRYNLNRVSISTHAGRVNPDITGRPTEIYIDRQRDAPIVHLWPLPSATGLYTMYYWILRRFDDAGAYTNTADVPFRFLPAFISGLALMIAEKRQPDNAALIMRLSQKYEADWLRASEEDREKATLTIVPKGSSYRVA